MLLANDHVYERIYGLLMVEFVTLPHQESLRNMLVSVLCLRLIKGIVHYTAIRTLVATSWEYWQHLLHGLGSSEQTSRDFFHTLM